MLVDVVALFLAVVTVSTLWYVIKRTFPDEVKDLQFFLTFIIVAIPFVMLIYLGLAVINYNAITTGVGWPQVLPSKKNELLLPVIVGTTAFYIGETVWLWRSWRK